MSRATVELDFFGMDRHRDVSSSKSQFQKFLHRQRSFRGIRNAMSKIKPEVFKTVINAPGSETTSPENLLQTMPMTIFYNGSVSVFDVPRDKAESILKLALEGNSTKAAESALYSSDQQQLLDPFNGDLPIARAKSLERFLQKRKERLNSVSPYACYT